MGPEESKQMNLAVLEKFVQAYNSETLPLALGNVLAVCSLRHGGNFAAFLYQPEYTSVYANTFSSMVEGEDFWQGHLRRIPWFPLRFGDTVAEALKNLVAFLDEDLIDGHTELCRWQSMCNSLAHALVETPEELRPDLNTSRWQAESFSRKS